jgi:predicted aspartyl protease
MREIMPLNRPHLALAAMATLAALFISERAVAANCELHLVASIPAKLSPSNQLLLDAKINDQPVEIQLDTGAAVSTIAKPFALHAGLQMEDMPGVLYGLTGQPLNEKTRVPSLRLGETTSKSETFVVMPVGSDGTDGGPIGLLGTDYLQNYDVEIDVAGGKVNLFSQDHCTDKVVYWAPEFFKTEIYYPGSTSLHRPTIDIQVEGKPIRALLDTGSYMTVMRMAAATDKFGLSPDSPDMQRAGETTGVEGRKLDTYLHTFQSMTFGDITLHNTKMAIAPINMAAHVDARGSHIKQGAIDEPDVMIGMSLLKQLHLFIAYGEKTLYYTIATPKQAASQ